MWNRPGNLRGDDRGTSFVFAGLGVMTCAAASTLAIDVGTVMTARSHRIGFFLEGRNGTDVYGRVTPILGVIHSNAGPAPAGVFPVSIRLVQ